jgi:hypothetical protein
MPATKPQFLQLLLTLLSEPNFGAPIRSWNICAQLDRCMAIRRVGFGPKPMNDPASIAVPLPRRYSVGKILLIPPCIDLSHSGGRPQGSTLITRNCGT